MGVYKHLDTIICCSRFMKNKLDTYKVLADKTVALHNFMEPVEKKEVEKLPEITIDDFAKMQLKTALVTACEKIAKSKKLLKVTLKVGDEERIVASGLAEYYTPEEMVGKKVVFVYNLKPAKLCVVESQGMILCAEADGKVKLITPEDPTLPDGADVG